MALDLHFSNKKMELGGVGDGGCRESFQSVSPTPLLKMEMTFISLDWNLPNSGKEESKCTPSGSQGGLKSWTRQGPNTHWNVWSKAEKGAQEGGRIGGEIHLNPFMVSHSKYVLHLRKKQMPSLSYSVPVQPPLKKTFNHIFKDIAIKAYSQSCSTNILPSTCAWGSILQMSARTSADTHLVPLGEC